MATLTEVDEALQSVVQLVDGVEPALRRRYAVERTVSCRIEDLAVAYTARSCLDGLRDVQLHDGHSAAQVRLQVSSDDLLALTQRRLALPVAWLTGRLRVEASVPDLLRLRALL